MRQTLQWATSMQKQVHKECSARNVLHVLSHELPSIPTRATAQKVCLSALGITSCAMLLICAMAPFVVHIVAEDDCHSLDRNSRSIRSSTL